MRGLTESERSFSSVDRSENLLDVGVGKNGEERSEDLLLGESKLGGGVDDESEGHSSLRIDLDVVLEIDDSSAGRLRFVEQGFESLEMSIRDDTAAIGTSRVRSKGLFDVSLSEREERFDFILVNAVIKSVRDRG